MDTHFGHRLRILHWCTDQAMTVALAQMELTAAQGHIMGYLAHSSQPPCPRDLEEAVQLSHPTVSGLLARLEKKDFIRFQPDPADRRCKRIYMQPKGQQCIETMHHIIAENESRIVRGFSPEEQAAFQSFLDRAISNMGCNPCKEDSTR